MTLQTPTLQQSQLQQSPIDQPTPQPTPAPEFKADISVNEFINDFTDSEVKPSADTIINEAGEPEVKPSDPTATAPKMEPEEARKKVAQFMRMRDMLQSKGLAFIAGRPEIHDTFKMEKWEFDWYCEVYESVVQDLGYIPKWLEIVLAEAFIMTPKIMSVINIRNESKKIEKYQAANQSTAATIQATGSVTTAQREDYKTRWIIDTNGYFTHDARGKYIPQGDRVERPVINEVNYNLLVKHNGPEIIEKVFKK